jgi:YgiT-type zinc finger domain-containing protein
MDRLAEPEKVRLMKCLVCHHEMTERRIALDLRVGEELIVVEEAPATICENCGEQVFTPKVTRQVQAAVKERKKAVRTMVVPVLSLDTASVSA